MRNIDPITVEVIGSALSSIVEEMGEALIRASYSTNIKERRDCSTALFDLAGNTLCQAEHIPMHLGSFLGLIPHIMKRHPIEEMRPGDVFCGNDAYEGGGTHLPDIVLAEPVFIEGEMTFWAVNLAHHADFADRGHAHIYQEGLRIPPIRLYRAGELQTDVQELILLNCQVPRERLSDFRAQMAANRLGVERLGALCEKYRRDVVLAAGAALQDYAERKMRAGIASIPDGTYSFADKYDCPEIDGEFDVSCSIEVSGDSMHLHFDGPPQIRAGLNMTYTALLSTVCYAVKAVVDPSIPPNAGLARPLHVTAPEGTVVNCVHPAAVNGRLSLCQRVVDLIFGALGQAVPDKVTAASNGACFSITFAGQQPKDNALWVYLETIGGGSGARPTKDGLDGVHVHMTNTSNLPVEALENEYPLTLLRYELVDGSGGAGRWRGGMGLRRVYRAEAPCRVRVDGARFLSAPWGLAGGEPGGKANVTLRNGARPFDHGNGGLRAGEIIDITIAGAGGHGHPRDRDKTLVARDLAEGRIDASTAHDAYHLNTSGFTNMSLFRCLLLGAVALLPASLARAEVPEVRFARQFSMGYLQFNVIEHEHLIQKHAAKLGIPEVNVTGVRFNGPSMMNDALLSDTVDIVGGSPNGMFALWAKTVGTPREVRAISALVTLPYVITTTDPDIKTIADLGKCKKIPVPSLKVSSPAISVQMAAVKLYGLKEFARFDPLTITMSPADATVALLSGAGEVNCSVALPPFMQFQLQDPKVHAIATSFDLAGGPTTYTLAYTSAKFRDKNLKLYQAIYDAMTEATERVAGDIRTAARYWIEDSDSKLTVDFVAAAGSGKDVKWTMVPEATLKQAEFMVDVGTIKVKPKSWKEYFFPEAYGLPGG